MKMYAALALCVCALGALMLQAEEKTTIGFVDTEKVLQGSLEFKEVDREARVKVEIKEEEGQKMLQDLRKMEEEIKVMAEDKQKLMFEEYRRKLLELEDFREKSREEILESQSVDLKRIANKIKDVIEKLGSELKMTLILDLKPILYLDRTTVIDLTDKVTNELNKQYDAEKQKMLRKTPTRVE